MGAISVGAVGIGLEKCLFVYLYLRCLKEMHSTVKEFTLECNTHILCLFQRLVTQ